MSRAERISPITEVKKVVTTTIFEKLLPPIKLEHRKEADLGLARQADAEKGDYKESANLYYSVLERGEGIEKLDALIGLSQQLINLGRFGQAKRFLDTTSNPARDQLKNLDTRRGFYYSGRIQEKLGWIADYEGDYGKSRGYFVSVVGKLNALGSFSELTQDEKKLYSTSIHFTGRAYFGLGDYDQAMQYFNEHLSIEGLNSGEKAFGHAWLARCLMDKKDYHRAEEEISIAKDFFLDFLNDYPKRGIMAHYCLLNGSLEFRKGNFETARNEFEQALEIRYTKERYPKGESEAMLGIAATYWAEKNIGAAFVYALKGIKTFPLSLIKPSA